MLVLSVPSSIYIINSFCKEVHCPQVYSYAFKVILLRVDGRVTDCSLRSENDLRNHSQHRKPAPRQKSKQIYLLVSVSSLINYPAYLSLVTTSVQCTKI